MNRLSGWRFFQLGHRVERAINTCRAVRQFGGEACTPDTLDTLLEWAESLRTYRMRYLHGAARGPVLDLIVLDEANPRSLAFSIAQIVAPHLDDAAHARRGRGIGGDADRPGSADRNPRGRCGQGRQ